MRAQVVLLRGRDILLARHECADRAYWVLPGGAVEPGERPEEAAVREVSEETGLSVRIDRLLFVERPRSHGAVPISSPRPTYLGEIVSGDLRSVRDAGDVTSPKGVLAGVEWMSFDAPELDEATRETLRLVRESLGA